MTTAGIRETIACALQHEARTDALRQSLAPRLPELRRALVFPEDGAIEALIDFVTKYVESVPSSLNLVTAVSKQLGFHDYAAPFLHMAEDYFLQPPELVPGNEGLEPLLDESFLAHRLLEEVNDHHIRHLQRPLLPLDMTEANLIVHHLLGEALALRLEQLVEFTASHLLEREYVWDKVKSLPGTTAQAPNTLDSSAVTGSPQQVRLRLAG